MSRVVVIGATGHVGTYLVPRLVRAGHEVVALSRGEREPYLPAPEWRAVERVTVDREAEDAAGAFGERIAALAPTPSSTCSASRPSRRGSCVDALRPGAAAARCTAARIWVHGPVARVPVTEDEPRTAYGEYGTGKAAIEALLHRETIAGGVPERGAPSRAHQRPVAGRSRPAGNLDLDVWRRLAAGEPLALPGARARRAAPRARRRRRAGVRARAHPTGRDRVELPRRVRAGDDAARPRRRRGRVVRPRAGARARRLGGVRAARRRRATPRRRASTSAAASPRASTGPARCSATAPRYSSLDALRESLRWLAANGHVDVGGQQL